MEGDVAEREEEMEKCEMAIPSRDVRWSLGKYRGTECHEGNRRP
jgi:hypothetical protein